MNECPPPMMLRVRLCYSHLMHSIQYIVDIPTGEEPTSEEGGTLEVLTPMTSITALGGHQTLIQPLPLCPGPDRRLASRGRSIHQGDSGRADASVRGAETGSQGELRYPPPNSAEGPDPRGLCPSLGPGWERCGGGWIRGEADNQES